LYRCTGFPALNYVHDITRKLTAAVTVHEHLYKKKSLVIYYYRY